MTTSKYISSNTKKERAIIKKRVIAAIIAAGSILSTATTSFALTALPIGTVNIRSGPGTTYGVVGALYDGQNATIVGQEGHWLKVKTGAGLTGYMADWVTRTVYDNDLYAQVDTDVLNVRKGPGTEFATIGQVQQGQQYRLLEGLGDWQKIDAGALGTGWVAAQYVRRVTQPPATQPPPVQPPDPIDGGDQHHALIKQVVGLAQTPLLAGRDSRYDELGSVSPGEWLTYLDSTDGWVNVANRSGVKGWVNGAKVSLSDKDTPYASQAIYGVRPDEWGITYLKLREVVQTSGLNVRTGPGTDAPVIKVLRTGDRMKLLSIPGGEFVQVRLQSGEEGWLSRNWIKPVPGAPTEGVRLAPTTPGILRLEIAGQSGLAAISASESKLTVGLGQNLARQASLAVAAHGVADMTMDSAGLTVRFEHPFRYQVVQNTQTSTVIEIRPVVQRVEQIQGPDRLTYRFHSVGNVEPVARAVNGGVNFELPGAQLASNSPLTIGALALTQGSNSLTGRIEMDRPYAIKRGATYTDLVIYQPGLVGKTIVIDPGHGGAERGATGPTGLREEQLNLSVGLKLRKLLEASGAKVVMTRTADTRCATPDQLANVPPDEHLRFDLNCRSEVANTIGADLFLSIHSNANASASERGTETYWTPENFNLHGSETLAGLVQQELIQSLGLRNRGVQQDIFSVIKFTDAPAVLAEIGFVSNATEEAFLRQDVNQQKAAEALSRALARYFR